MTAAQACHATALVFPAVEIIDSRFLNFKFGLSDVIADNTSASRVIFGSAFLKPADADLRLIGMVYAKNGVVESTAAGAAILGNPWEALAWLARRASELGRPCVPDTWCWPVPWRTPSSSTRATAYASSSQARLAHSALRLDDS